MAMGEAKSGVSHPHNLIMERFDKDTHTYYRGDKKLPSVTEVLNFGQKHFWKPSAARRGTDVHTLCQYLDEKDFDESSVDPSYVGYVKSYREALKAYKPEWQVIEKIYYGDRFAGTVDRIGVIADCKAIVDLKTGKSWNTHGPQLAGYAILAGEEHFMEYRRFCWYLDSSGYVAATVEYKDPSDFITFNNKLKEWEDANA